MRLQVQKIDVPTKADVREPIEVKIFCKPEFNIAHLKSPKILVEAFMFLNDLVAGKDFLELEVTSFTGYQNGEDRQLDIKFSFAKIQEQSEVFLKKGKENIGRLVLQFPTDNGSETVVYNIVVFLYEDNQILYCAFVTQ